MSSEPDDMKASTGGEAPAPVARKRPHPIIVFLVGFAISLGVGLLFQLVTSPETLEGAKTAQESWKTSVEMQQPFAVATQYWDDVTRIWNGGQSSSDSYSLDGGRGGGIATPVMALAVTGTRLFETGGIWALLNLVLAALAIAVYNYRRSNGLTIFFDDFVGNGLVAPFLIVGVASVFALALQLVMLVAVTLVGWVTHLAAAAAGATGVAGFCWFCFTELGKKGVEHVVTPKFRV